MHKMFFIFLQFRGGTFPSDWNWWILNKSLVSFIDEKTILSENWTPPPPPTTVATQPPPSRDPDSPTLPPTGPPTQPPSDEFCQDKTDGIYPVAPDSCSSTFYQCAGGITYVTQCAPGLVFNSVCTCCDWPANVPACST